MNDVHVSILADVFRYLIPEIVLATIACVLFLGGTFRANRHLWAWVALGGLAGAILATLLGPQPEYRDETARIATFASPLVFDQLATLTRLIAYGGGIVLLLLSWNELPDAQASDHHACLVTIAAGVGLVGCANDLVTLFLALELISIPTYVLLYLPKHDAQAQEASIKYFLLSVFSSALLLFGFSYLYGVSGTTNMPAILQALNSQPSARELPVLTQAALILIVAGLGFRITAVPFHFYAPDVFQGAATVSAALLAFIPKVAGFVGLVRVLGFVLPPEVNARAGQVGMALSDQAPILLWFLAALTMSLGNVLALLQDNVKRLLAYSSVAHAGYMLVALASAPFLTGQVGSPHGIEALLYYLVAYGAMTVGAFAVLSYLSSGGRPVETVDELAGLSRTHPLLAFLMAIFLFSLIGIPLTAGFTGKFLIFLGAVAVEGSHANIYILLAVIGMINAAIGGWYYLRLIAVMYLRNALEPIRNQPNRPAYATIVVCAVLTVGLSLPPAAGWLLRGARGAAGASSVATPVAGQGAGEALARGE